MNVVRYLRAITPINVLDLLGISLLESLLNGYSFALNAGITIVYPTEPTVSLDSLHRQDALGAEARRSFHPLCAYWRNPEEGCGQDHQCTDADKEVALRFSLGEFRGPRLYRCKPLGLWDMTFPLTIDGRIIGVLFGGQVIVRDGEVNWREALRNHEPIVDWGSCPDMDIHFDAIEKAIESQCVEDDLKLRLLDTLDVARGSNGSNISLQEFLQRVEDFLRFGAMTQGLLNELHEARKTAAEQELLRACGRELAAFDLTEPERWWQDCGRVLTTLLVFPEIENVCLYVRHGAKYARNVSVPTETGLADRLTARSVIPAFSAGQLVSASSITNKDFLRDLGLQGEEGSGFRSETGLGHEVCSSLVVFRGVIPESRRDFFSALGSVVCAASDSASLIFREREADLQYRHRVTVIGHSFRTPLQALQFALEDLKKGAPISTDTGLSQQVSQGMGLIKDARDDLLNLLEPSEKIDERFDLLRSLDYALKNLEPIARNHPCRIVRLGDWPSSIYIRGDEYRVRKALTCLADNAIKYSYGLAQRTESSVYEVRVWVEVAGRHANVMLSNYGIGIPPNVLKAFGEYGMRGKVADAKGVRLGTGVGLPFAIEVFERLGGWVHVTSVPAKSASKEEISKFHRYVTTVEIGLPVA
jgi:signal transduction histidine kinase